MELIFTDEKKNKQNNASLFENTKYYYFNITDWSWIDIQNSYSAIFANNGFNLYNSDFIKVKENLKPKDIVKLKWDTKNSKPEEKI